MPAPIDTRSPRPRSLHSRQVHLRMARTYYELLQEDANFRQDLGTLFGAFQQLGFRELVAELFVREWALPLHDGLKDLRWSHRWRRSDGEPRLIVGPRFFPPSPTTRMPPRLASPGARLIRARRLYLYVCLGWGYHRIAKDEGVDPRAVVDSVRYWAKCLGIPLRRGRRHFTRKSRSPS